jgi:hypothetical protein
MKRKLLFLTLTTLLYSQEIENYSKLKENYDFLEISKNYLETHQIHEKVKLTNRTLKQLNNINFALSPKVSPIKPFDTLEVHYVYPLKIFLPENFTVTSSNLSNSTKQPTNSQNVITVNVDNNFQSGLLDIVYVEGSNLKKGNYLSIKLDKYVYSDESELDNHKLFTQIKYFKSEKIDNNKILSALKSFEYELPHSQVSYMGTIYDIKLVNVIDKDGNYIKKLLEDKYINCALIYNDKTYNYYVK